MKAIAVLVVLTIAAIGGLGMWRALDPGPKRERLPAPAEVSQPKPKSDKSRVSPPVPRLEAPADNLAAERAARGARLRALNEEGLALLEADDFEGAIDCFERCLELQPGNEAFAFNLSEALGLLALELYQDGERNRAIKRLTRAVATSKARKDLLRILVRWRATAADEDKMWKYETDHFELVFDGRRTDLLYGAQDVLDVLEAAYLEFQSTFNHDPVGGGRARVRVVMTSRPNFESATGLGEWAGGAFDGTIRLPLEDLNSERERWTRVLRHELGHVWVREVGGKTVPGWLNEGFCQWIEGNRARLVSGARRQLEDHALFSLDQLTGSLIHWEDSAEVGRAYAQAFLFLDSLIQTYSVRVAIAMIEGCAERIDPGESFERETLVSLELAFADFVGSLTR